MEESQYYNYIYVPTQIYSSSKELSRWKESKNN